MMLVAGQERDVRLGVLKRKDITKWLRFEETETEREVRELARERVEAGAERGTPAKGEGSSFDMERLERTDRENFQEVQSHGASATTLRGHVDHQGLDKS